MALKTKYEFIGNVYENAYLKITRISISNSDVEKLVSDGDIDKIVFENQKEAIAFVLIYADQEAREKNVRPIHHFGFQFQYTDYDRNPFNVAYNSLYQELQKTGDVESV